MSLGIYVFSNLGVSRVLSFLVMDALTWKLPGGLNKNTQVDHYSFIHEVNQHFLSAQDVPSPITEMHEGPDVGDTQG